MLYFLRSFVPPLPPASSHGPGSIGPVEDVSIFRRLVGSERMGTVCFADAATAERAAGQFDKKLLCPPPKPGAEGVTGRFFFVFRKVFQFF